MQSIFINNLLLNEIADKILSSRNSFLKKGMITALVLIALIFYGLDSFFGIFTKK